MIVCKVEDVSDIDLNTGICFVGKTDEQISLYEGRRILRLKESSVMTAGADSVLKELDY